MHLLLGIPVLALGAIALLVGGRLLLLARRTRGAPEFCIGMGFYLNAVLGHPLMAGSGWAGPTISGMNLPLFAVGSGFVAIGVMFLFGFTWRVFRPRAAWASWGTALACLLLAAQAAGMIHALATAPPESRPHEATAAWATLEHALVGISLGWTGLESLLFYAKMRRRLALGLADPVVANRFLLWAIFGISTFAILVVNAAYHMAGFTTLNHPVCQLVTVLGALLASGAMYLAFLPPAAFVRAIQRRARLRVA
jgi:hypothetical protein